MSENNSSREFPDFRAPVQEGQHTPEQLLEYISIRTIGETPKVQKKLFKSGAQFRWSYNRDNFNLLVWPAYRSEHREVDQSLSRAGTVGYYSNGDKYVGFWGNNLEKNEKTGIKLSLDKFFKT